MDKMDSMAAFDSPILLSICTDEIFKFFATISTRLLKKILKHGIQIPGYYVTQDTALQPKHSIISSNDFWRDCHSVKNDQ